MSRLSESGVALARGVYESLNEGDLEAFFALLHPEIELREEFLAPDVAVYRGHDGVREWLQRTMEAFAGARFEPGRFMRVGDAVVIPVRLIARGAGSGAEVAADLVHVGVMRDGLVSLLAAYPDLQSALAEAGRGVQIAPEPFDAPDSRELLAALKTELHERNGEGADPGSKPSADDITAFLVARDEEGAALGCGAVWALGDDAVEIKRMYVRPEARGRGLGWLILAALESEAERRGYAVLRLETGDFQPEALALYRAAGYREIPCFGAYAGAPHSRCFERRL
jgi:ketosteroid isomerase-like protein/GNAT superfamily N-acetyltransferase